MLNDKQYVPMKLKEMAMLLQIPKENRSELKAVLDALILEGKAEVTSKGKYRRATAKTVTGVFTCPSERLWLRGSGRARGGCFYRRGKRRRCAASGYGTGTAAAGFDRKAAGGAHSANSGARHSRSDRHVSEEPDLWVCSAGQPADYDGYFCLRRSTAWARCRDTKCLWS